MKLLEVACATPVPASARMRRDDLTRAINDGFRDEPLSRLREPVGVWLDDGSDLLRLRDRYAHSITCYEVRGDGSSGSYSHHPKTGDIQPVVDEATVEAQVLRLAAAGSEGARLEIAPAIRRTQGVQAYEAHLRSDEDYQDRVRR